ncbi:transcription factor p65-like isoform X2 [Anneissia japonica]|uniref:transcription factor p65-like isoform X2 n=1 Tax=Anneissia japonica TaxID=1529436 RepID=UPI0014258858|nr:transcription factor p65-like isoform X2 [Anneissia japonica]
MNQMKTLEGLASSNGFNPNLAEVDQGIIADISQQSAGLPSQLNFFDIMPSFGQTMSTENGNMPDLDTWLSPKEAKPAVEIVEQPKQKDLRFRYECEGRSAGSIPGEKSSSDKKTFPSIRITNYKGSAKVVVSLVTREKGRSDPRPHPHGLVGKDCNNGICIKNLSKADKIIKFENLGIQCIKKKDIVTALEERINQGIDPYNNFRLTTRDPKKLAAEYDLTTVCVCFQVYIANESEPDQPNIPLPPVYTQPIFDKKGATLNIARVDRRSGSIRGGEELFILCDKIHRDDIEVKFVEGKWSENADFSPTDIHRQVAIVCKTPAYKDLHIRDPVTVHFKLVRPSDNEESQLMEFTYLPDDNDPFKVGVKRKRNQPSYDNFIQDNSNRPAKSEFRNIPQCRFIKPGSESRKKPNEVKQRLKEILGYTVPHYLMEETYELLGLSEARRSNASASVGRAPDEEPANSTPGTFFKSSSGNTGTLIQQGQITTTIDSTDLFSLLNTSEKEQLVEGDVRINLGGASVEGVDESEVQMNFEKLLNPYLTIPVGNPSSIPEPSPMDQTNTVLDLLAPMAQGYEDVIPQDVPCSMAMTLGSEASNQEAKVIDTAVEEMLNGGEIVIENFPSLANYLNELDPNVLHQQIQLQQQIVRQPMEQQEQLAESNTVGDEYIFEEVHDSLNLPLLNSIDIEQVNDFRNNPSGTM